MNIYNFDYENSSYILGEGKILICRHPHASEKSEKRMRISEMEKQIITELSQKSATEILNDILKNNEYLSQFHPAHLTTSSISGVLKQVTGIKGNKRKRKVDNKELLVESNTMSLSDDESTYNHNSDEPYVGSNLNTMSTVDTIEDHSDEPDVGSNLNTMSTIEDHATINECGNYQEITPIYLQIFEKYIQLNVLYENLKISSTLPQKQQKQISSTIINISDILQSNEFRLSDKLLKRDTKCTSVYGIIGKINGFKNESLYICVVINPQSITTDNLIQIIKIIKTSEYKTIQKRLGRHMNNTSIENFNWKYEDIELNVELKLPFKLHCIQQDNNCRKKIQSAQYWNQAWNLVSSTEIVQETKRRRGCNGIDKVVVLSQNEASNLMANSHKKRRGNYGPRNNPILKDKIISFKKNAPVPRKDFVLRCEREIVALQESFKKLITQDSIIQSLKQLRSLGSYSESIGYLSALFFADHSFKILSLQPEHYSQGITTSIAADDPITECQVDIDHVSSNI